MTKKRTTRPKYSNQPALELVPTPPRPPLLTPAQDAEMTAVIRQISQSYPYL